MTKLGNVPSWRAATYGLTMLGLVVANAGRPPRNFSCVSTEQIVVEQMWDVLDWEDPDRRRRHEELERRPVAELRRVAYQLAGSANPIAIAVASSLLEMVARKLGPGGKAEVRTEVEAMLVDADAAIRRRGLLLFACVDDLDLPLPDPLFAVARSLLESPQPEVCAEAMFVAAQLGSRVAPLRDALVKFHQRDIDGGLRFMATVVLGRVRPVDADLQSFRLALLQDREPMVRRAVTLWFADRPEGGAVAIPRLVALAHDAAESEETRSQAVSALARLMTERESAAPVFSALLQRARAAGPEQAATFYVDLARFARAMAGTGELASAAAWLRTQAADESNATAVLAALAQCAIADATIPFSAADVQVLRAAMTRWFDLEVDLLPSLGDQEAVEALVQLAAHGRMDVQAAEIRPLLDRIAKCDQGWLRDWANDQIGLLPP
ncbi:MAG: hypothetical protein JNK15_24880 [Planctomycetes bacterium]|nr:hypothetical protein [Planctomycetota bacterium]